MGVGAAVVGAVVGTVGVVQQYEAGRAQKSAMQQQSAAQQRQYALSQQQAEIQNIRSVRQQLRQRYATAAALTARGATAGTLSGSGLAGGLSSLGSQLASNLGYQSDIAGTQAGMAREAAVIGQAQTAYGIAAGQAAQGAAFTSLGSTIFTAVGGSEQLKKIINSSGGSSAGPYNSAYHGEFEGN